MRSLSLARRHNIHGLLLAGAVAMGLGGWFPLHGQEALPPVKGPDAKGGKAATDAPVAKRRAQQLATRKAKAAYESARLTHEIAEIAVIEYQEGIFAQDLATVDAEIKLARSDLARAEDRLKRTRRMVEKKFKPMAQKISEELSFKKAKFTLEQAQSKRKVLVDYTKAKTIKELKSEVEKARADELAKREAWEQEKVKETHLERQLGPVTN
jgi:hypothetical protein